MKVLVSLYKWENPRLCSSESELSKGDKIVIEGEFGPDIGTVLISGMETADNPQQNVLRKATQRDIEAFKKNNARKNEIVETARKEAKTIGLEMKIIDARSTLDGGNMIVAFTANERVDFRELVKAISKLFHRSVRMQQIGSRDEARKLGGCGICGRELCCVRFSGNLPSITTEMARVQQIAHRGSERISGLCGRLMCCLSFESEQYKELLSGMPELHSFVKVKEGKGEVMEINAIKQEIKIKTEDDKILTIKKDDLLG